MIASAVTEELPLFPVKAMLFPMSRLAMRVFEPRYVAMVKQCASQDAGFVSVYLQHGHEVLPPGVKHIPDMAPLGVYAKIVDFDAGPNLSLNIVVEGHDFCEMDALRQQSDGLVLGQCGVLKQDETVDIAPLEYDNLQELVSALLKHPQLAILKLDVEQLTVVGLVHVLCQYLPFSDVQRMSLLTAASVSERLRLIHRFMAELSA